VPVNQMAQVGQSCLSDCWC